MTPEFFQTIECPYCGQPFDISIDSSQGDGTFTTDCEICCRPIEVTASSDPEGDVILDVRPG